MITKNCGQCNKVVTGRYVKMYCSKLCQNRGSTKQTSKNEAHHILAWRSYPELRYEINNGITLCHAHHPRGEAKEKRLVPRLQGLVSVLSE